MMNKESYERLSMDVTQFDAEDVITTSGLTPSQPDFKPNDYEGVFIPTGM